MEIARLEVSTQQHLDRMQETVKVNYVQYGKSTKSKKGKKSTQSGAGANSQRSDRGHGIVIYSLCKIVLTNKQTSFNFIKILISSS